MRNKFVYSCSIKIHAMYFDELLESIFWLLLVVEVFFLQKVFKMLEEVVIDWQEIKWMLRMRLNFVAWFIQLLKCSLCNILGNFQIAGKLILTIFSCEGVTFWRPLFCHSGSISVPLILIFFLDSFLIMYILKICQSCIWCF